MDEHTQLTEAAELVGKTIARVSGLGDSGPDAIAFTDGSFVVLDVECYGDDDAELSIDAKPASPHTLMSLNFISPQECRERERAELQARAAAAEARARAEYEHLKAKFEPQSAEAT